MARMRWRGLFRALAVRRELKGLRADMAGVRSALERIAQALERQGPQATRAATPEDPLVAITYADDAVSQEFMDIELRLTAARGQPPTEEEILMEWEQRQGQRQPPIQ